MPQVSISQQIRQIAAELGFQLVGICPATTPTGVHRLFAWLDAGYGADMNYLRDRAEAYQHPNGVLPGVVSLVMLGMNYHAGPRAPVQPGHGAIASYARGQVDYHDLIHKRLKQFRRRVHELCPDASVRGVVDTAPLLEREFAQLAGLGWVGKNTMLLNRQHGSYFFLAALLTDLQLEYDEPFASDHCGSCTACIEACPTQAFPAPYVLDARRCISYLTIEHRGELPEDIRGSWGDWLFGCDVCQEVCPWNRRASLADEPLFAEAESTSDPQSLCEMFYWDEQQFYDRFRKTALWRTRRQGILRNAAMLLAAQRYRPGLPALQRGAEDDDPIVQAACRWALARLERSD